MFRKDPPVVPAEVQKRVISEIEKIEKENDIHIILCVEAGSRAWDLPSQDSDYDIRFIYAYPPNKYVTVDPMPEEIKLHDGILDIHGVDLRGAFRLAVKNEPSIYEWLESEIVYKEDFDLSWIIREAASIALDPPALARCYYGIANRTFNNDIKWVDHVKIKKYLYCLRAILCATYILDTRQPVPLRLDSLLEYSPYETQDEIKRLMAEKGETIDNAIMDKKYALEEQVSDQLSKLVIKMYGDFPTGSRSFDKMDKLLYEYVTGKNGQKTE